MPCTKNNEREMLRTSIKNNVRGTVRGKRGKLTRGKSEKSWVKRGLCIQFDIERPLAGGSYLEELLDSGMSESAI